METLFEFSDNWELDVLHGSSDGWEIDVVKESLDSRETGGGPQDEDPWFDWTGQWNKSEENGELEQGAQTIFWSNREELCRLGKSHGLTETGQFINGDTDQEL